MCQSRRKERSGLSLEERGKGRAAVLRNCNFCAHGLDGADFLSVSASERRSLAQRIRIEAVGVSHCKRATVVSLTQVFA